jgi:hypothetical protein
MGAVRFEFQAAQATATKYIHSLAQRRLPPPGKVFCSRELESGLVDFVTERTAPFGLGEFPSDDELRARAKEVLGTPGTAADDAVLLGKFKDMVREKLALGLGAPTTTTTLTSLSGSSSTLGSSFGQGAQGQGQQLSASAASSADSLLADVSLDPLTDSQMTDILQDMDFQFGDMTGLDDPVLGSGFGL